MEVIDALIKGVPFVQSPNHGGSFKEGLPDTIIIHYTAGSSAESSIRYLTDKNSKASAHLVVGRDGSVTQLVKFDTVAWHAGASQYNNRIGYNQFSIGIEIDNAGFLEKRGDKYYSWFNHAYPEDQVMKAAHRNQSVPAYWHVYTEQQINSVLEVCRLLVDTYNIRFILGHEEISPGRKVDPGPAFPLDKFRELLLGGARNEDVAEGEINKEGLVTVDLLNIRTGPGLNEEKVAKPLPKGQKVKILAAKNGWLKISTEISGWVSAKFVK